MKSMIHCTKGVFFVLLFVGLAQTAMADSIGMIADRSDHVTVFDPDTDTVLATIAIDGGDGGLFLFDCLILEDQSLGFVTDLNTEAVWVIDLEADPPELASGTNPIPVSAEAEDLSITPDQKFLVVSGGFTSGGDFELSVVDIEAREEIETFDFGDGHPSAAEVCADGSVLIVDRASGTETTIRRFTIDEDGMLTDTGELIEDDDAPDVNDVTCTFPGGKRSLFGLYTSRRANFELGSFEVDGMIPVDTVEPTGPFAIDLVVSHDSKWVYVRSNGSIAPGPSGAGDGFVDAFRFDRNTGEFKKLAFTIDLGRRTGTAFGAEQMAVNEEGNKLYVAGLRLPEVRVYNAKKGKLRHTIEGPGIVAPTGVAVMGSDDD